MPVVTLLYFASMRDRLACSQEAVDLPGCLDAAALLQVLAERHPQASELILSSRVAVDQEFARGEIRLSATAEIAIIPPVSGG